MDAPEHIIVVAGPTASGKSSLAMMLAQHVELEIISADSAQVYRHLHVGTAKPSLEEQAEVRHHLIDVCELNETFDAGTFAEKAERIIEEVRSRGHLPAVVGGTGLYIRALLYGIVDLPPGDEGIRGRLRERLEDIGSRELHSQLAGVDPACASSLHPNDTVRVIRALEVFELTGRRMSDVQQEHKVRLREPRHEGTQLAIAPQREVLYDRINRRVDVMIDELGWVAEVERLLEEGADPDSKGLMTLGYRHLVDHLLERDDAPSLAEATRRIKRDHRRYAKRQLTWFRAQPALEWFPDAESGLARLRTSHQSM